MLINHPKWLRDAAGYREKEIMHAEDAYKTNFVEDGNSTSLERLQPGLLYLVSPSSGRFMIDTKTRKIIG